jgi:hypothetical protein
MDHGRGDGDLFRGGRKLNGRKKVFGFWGRES